MRLKRGFGRGKSIVFAVVFGFVGAYFKWNAMQSGGDGCLAVVRNVCVCVCACVWCTPCVQEVMNASDSKFDL